MTDRQRIRRGRTVSYNPTAAEEAVSGEGPYLAMITNVNQDGTVDLLIDTPAPTAVSGAAIGAALSDPIVTSPDGSDPATTQTLANEIKADVNTMVTRLNEATALLNELRGVAINTRKSSVARGAQAGQFSLFQTGPQAL